MSVTYKYVGIEHGTGKLINSTISYEAATILAWSPLFDILDDMDAMVYNRMVRMVRKQRRIMAHGMFWRNVHTQTLRAWRARLCQQKSAVSLSNSLRYSPGTVASVSIWTQSDVRSEERTGRTKIISTNIDSDDSGE